MKQCALFALFSFYTTTAQQLQYPVTPKGDDVDEYFGVKVPDPYRWLEQDTAAAVTQWVKQQNEVTFDYLEQIPYRNQVRERLNVLFNHEKQKAPFKGGNNWFFYKNNGLQNQDVLYILRGSLTAMPEVFLDPNTFSTDGTVALTDIQFDKNGKYAAYAISTAGSDWREIYVMDVKTKKMLNDKIEWVKFSSITWFGNGFYYSSFGKPQNTASTLTSSNTGHKIYYHVLGTPQQHDHVVFEDQKHPQRLFDAGITEDQRFLYISALQGSSTGNALYVRDIVNRTEFKPVIESFDDEVFVAGSIDGKLLLRTYRNAPNGRLVLVDPARTAEKNWKNILPEGKDKLDDVKIIGRKIIAAYIKDASHRLRVFNIKGTFENEIQLPAFGKIDELEGKANDNMLFYTFTSFTYPPTIFQYDLRTKKSVIHYQPKVDFNTNDYITEQVFYVSKDCTKVPMFIVRKKEFEQNGDNTAWLYGYGGFNNAILPDFKPTRIAWLEQGGIYALANIRGGSEYGEWWHEQGMKLKKQNVFDDFIAAAEYLIANKYTNPQKLAIEGRSNGGLLIGAVINQRPELFRVAFPAVGVMDMLRFQKFTIGWAWVGEYGLSDNAEEFQYLYKYSPLHNIREGINYPAVFVTTADHDDRVVPAHSFKYIATLQEKYKGPNPTLIRIEVSAGHGSGKPTTKLLDEWSDMYSFAWWNMDVTPEY